MRKKPLPGHKLGAVSIGHMIRCECGWTSTTCFGRGSRADAYTQWEYHKEKCAKEMAA